MKQLYFRSVPYIHEDILLALESGVNGIVVEESRCESVRSLALTDVRSAEFMPVLTLSCKDDEILAANRLAAGEDLVLGQGWEIIAVENLLAHPDPRVSQRIFLEAGSYDEARLGLEIMEKGAAGLCLLPSALPDIKAIVDKAANSQGQVELLEAEIIDVRQTGLGHRVCVDTLSLLHRGQGLLTGNTSSFFFLVHAETEGSEYVASRPFRVNAGGVHAYAMLPGGITRYLEELRAGDAILVADHEGTLTTAVAGRIKREVRPMIYITARLVLDNGEEAVGGVFLQNAETVCLTGPGGIPRSVVGLKPGDRVLVHTASAGRHFGMPIKETIEEK